MTTSSVDVGHAEKQLVVFDLASELYGVDIGVVREIIRMQKLTRVPESAAYFEGVINLRGKIIPVIDLRKRLGQPISEQDNDTLIVVVDVNEHDIGVIVDAVAEVLRISADSIEPTTSVITTSDSQYLLGIAKLEDKLIILLDLEQALSDTQMSLRSEIVEIEAESQSEEAPPVDIESVLPSDTQPAEPTDASPASGNINAPEGEEILWSMYGLLFSKYPEVKPVFSDVDMHKQKDVLLEYLASIFKNLNKPKSLKPAVQKLVEYHRLIGLHPEHHAFVGSVLEDTFAEHLGEQWTDSLKENWTKAYESIISALST